MSHGRRRRGPRTADEVANLRRADPMWRRCPHVPDAAVPLWAERHA
jgi:hypothetical protein